MAGQATGEKVLVTGASGCIAGHCIRELLEHGYAVRGTVRSLAATAKTAHLSAIAENTGSTIEFAESDLSNDAGVGRCRGRV